MTTDIRTDASTSTLASHMPTPLSVLMIILIVVMCYVNILQNGFIGDDHYIIEVNGDPLNVGSVFSAFTSVDRLVESDVVPYYRPFARISYLVDRATFRLDPSGYHVVNLSLHVLCALLMYFVLIRLDCDPIVSVASALLFGVHPINSQAVNFISARNNILSSIFVLGSLLVFFRAERQHAKSGYVFSGFLFFLGLLSKETAIMALPIIILLKITYEKSWKNMRTILLWDVAYILPHVLFLGVYLFLRFFAIDNNYIYDNAAGFVGRIRQAVYILPAYASMVTIPRNLNFVHEIPKRVDCLAMSLLVRWTLLIVAVTALLHSGGRIARFGLIWFVINFIPVSNLVPMPSAPMAERYLYLPMMGIFAAVMDASFHLAKKFKFERTLIASLLTVVVLCGFVTFERNKDWRDDLSWTQRIVKVNPTYALGHFDLAYELMLRGDALSAAQSFKTALELGLQPVKTSWANYYLGVINAEAGRWPEAELFFQKAVQANSGNYAAHYILASRAAVQKRREALKEYADFLQTMELQSVPLLTEVNNKIRELDSSMKYRTARDIHNDDGEILSNNGKLLLRFASGTRFYYYPLKNKRDDVLTITTRQRLSRLDLRALALKLVRYQFDRVSDARFVFTIHCGQKIFKTDSLEILAADGRVLGLSYPEKENYTMYEYLVPGTPLRSLADKVCNP